ncbi:MAG: ABC transporter permease [Candidatus Aminicenantales bacterium]
MFQTITHIVKKEFIQTFRDRRMLFPLFIVPVLQLILFGYAVTTDIKNIHLAVLDLDRTQESRTLISLFESSEYFSVDYTLTAPDEIDRLVQTGRVKAAVVVPANFSRNIKKMKQTSLQVILDGTDANTATIIQSYIQKLTAEYLSNIKAEVRKTYPLATITPQPRVWYNPALKSSHFMVPGVICLILLMSTLILTSMAITKEREMGTLEQLIVSPIKPMELIIGKTVPFIIIGFIDVILILIAGKLIFNLPIKGSIVFLLFVSFIFILTTLSTGTYISTISRTQQQAMMTTFFFIMPAMLLSGIFSPLESMPRIIQYLTYLNPLRYYVYAVRGILLKGNGFSQLWPEIVVLFIFGFAASTFSSLRFRKYLE